MPADIGSSVYSRVKTALRGRLCQACRQYWRSCPFFIDDESDTIGYADSGFGRERQPAEGDRTVGLCHRPFGVGEK